MLSKYVERNNHSSEHWLTFDSVTFLLKAAARLRLTATTISGRAIPQSRNPSSRKRFTSGVGVPFAEAFGPLRFSCIKYLFRPCSYGFRRRLSRDHYLRCASVGLRFVTSSVYRVLDYPGTLVISYLWSLQVQHVAIFLFLLFGRANIPFSQSSGVVSGMGQQLLLQPCMCLLVSAVVGAACPQHRDAVWDQGCRAGNSFLVMMFITSRGMTCTCMALGQRSGYRGTKGATIPNTMMRWSLFRTGYLAPCHL